VTILVTGATGVLGTLVADGARRQGLAVRTAARSGADVAVDLVSGAGLENATTGIDAVIHCATDPRRHRRVDVAGTRRLLAQAAVPIVLPSIVGCDVIPLGYYRSKLAAEELVTAHGPGFTILRATQFHHLVWNLFDRLARPPLMVVPHDTRFQAIDPSAVARMLVDAAMAGPAGRLDDIGGPFAYDARDLARSVLAATGRRRPIVRFNLPGLAGAALRAGGNLTPNRDIGGETWNEFVMGKTAA
jgi:uncharacterized protein YbjT (DUF2867 family)